MKSKINNPGLGIEYEIVVPAFYSLMFTLNDDIADFTIESNAKNFDLFDDLVITITYKNEKQDFFAIQLKHTENDSAILPTSFDASTGQFSIKKYHESYKKYHKTKFKYILFTNKKFSASNTIKVQRYKMEICKDDALKWILDTNRGTERNIFQFSNDDCYDDFFSAFYLVTSQRNQIGLEYIIINVFRDRFKSSPETAISFINFFRRWHRCEFTNTTINRETVLIHLLDLTLSPFIIHLQTTHETQTKIQIFESCLSMFDVTFLKNLDEDYIKTNWRIAVDKDDLNNNAILEWAHKHKLVSRRCRNLQFEIKDKCEVKMLWFTRRKPLVVNYNAQSKNTVDALAPLMATLVSFVLVSKDFDDFNCDKRIFRSLRDLEIVNKEAYRGLVENYQASIQGRKEIYFQDLIDFDDDLNNVITPSEVFKSIKSPLEIGAKEDLPPHCIKRNVIIKVLTIDDIVNTKDLFIVTSGFLNVIRRYFEGLDKNVDSLETGVGVKSNLILVTQQDNVDFKRFSGNVHVVTPLCYNAVPYFKWIRTLGDSRKIKNLLKPLEVAESDAIKSFNSNVEILCGTSGMGKSTIMSVLKMTCPCEYWTVKVQLGEHSDFFKTRNTVKDGFARFLKREYSFFADCFVKRNQLFWFFDGVDELSRECIENFFLFVENLRELKHKVWISSRSYLERVLVDRFNVNPIEIQEINEEAQNDYILGRLSDKYETDKISRITKKINDSVHVLNNQNLLGVPLQLFILTQKFIDNDDYFNEHDDSVFIVTKMYKSIFEGRFTFLVLKTGSAGDIHQIFDEYLEIIFEKYEVPALKASLEDGIFKELGVKIDMRFAAKMERNGDALGIIVSTFRDQDEVSFNFFHQTYAEYFGAKWFMKNLQNIPRDKRAFLLDKKHQGLKYFLDILSAEECPAHLAVLYKNTDFLKKCRSSEITKKDKFGRSVLHVLCSSGEEFPLEQTKSYNVDKKYQAILDCLMNPEIPFLDKDDFLEKSALDYADDKFSLSSLAHLAKLAEIDLNKLPKCRENVEAVIYNSIRFGYRRLLEGRDFDEISSDLKRVLLITADDQNILKFLLDKNCGDLKIRDKEGQSLLHIITTKNYVDLVDGLLQKIDINARDTHGRTALHLSILYKRTEISKKLLSSVSIDVDIRDNEGRLPLHYAVFRNQLEIVRALLKKKTDVNAVDNYGNSALHTALDWNRVDCAKLLLNEEEIDVECKDYQGRSAFDIAKTLGSQSGLEEVVKKISLLDTDSKKEF